MKRNVEIEDTLQECVDGAIEEVEALLREHLAENPDRDEPPDLSNDLDYSGAVHEAVDSAVPIHTAEIDGLFYLYGAELERAFDDAGIGEKSDDGWPCGWKAAAIYCYIEEQVADWYSGNAEEIFDEVRETRDKAEETDA